MKHTTPLLLFILLLTACDRRLPPPAFAGTTTIPARIVDPRDSIGINDTVRIQMELPDSIEYNGSWVKVSYGPKDLAYASVRLGKIDTTQAGAIGAATGSTQLALTGSFGVTQTMVFRNNGNSMTADFAFMPRSRGVYYLDEQLPGQVSANNGQYLLDLYIDYGNIPRNHRLLIDSARPASGFDRFIQGRISHGLEVYGFRAY